MGGYQLLGDTLKGFLEIGSIDVTIERKGTLNPKGLDKEHIPWKARFQRRKEGFWVEADDIGELSSYGAVILEEPEKGCGAERALS